MERIGFSENVRSPRGFESVVLRGWTRAQRVHSCMWPDWDRNGKFLLVHRESLGFSKPKTRGIVLKPKNEQFQRVLENLENKDRRVFQFLLVLVLDLSQNKC